MLPEEELVVVVEADCLAMAVSAMVMGKAEVEEAGHLGTVETTTTQSVPEPEAEEAGERIRPGRMLTRLVTELGQGSVVAPEAMAG